MYFHVLRSPKVAFYGFHFERVGLLFLYQVTSQYGNSYHYADHVPSGQFAFQASEAGDYMACFWAADHKPQATITVDFDWKSGVAAKDWTNVAKKGSIDVSPSLHIFYVCKFYKCLAHWYTWWQ